MGFFFLAQGSFLAHHERKTWLVTVARGPVPRDLSTQRKTSAARRLRTFSKDRARRGTGPRPTFGKRASAKNVSSGSTDLKSASFHQVGIFPERLPLMRVFHHSLHVAVKKTPPLHRRARALGCHTRIRAGFPRHASIAGDRPPRYGKKTVPFHRRAWALACHTCMRAGVPRHRLLGFAVCVLLPCCK